MGACTYPLGRTGNPTTAEVKVCLQAIIFGEKMGFRDLVVEGDALLSLLLERQMKWHTPLQLEGKI